MKFVWIINMYSSGERWHNIVCESAGRANVCLRGYAMTREYGNDESEYQDWRNLRDISQTATVQKVVLLENIFK